MLTYEYDLNGNATKDGSKDNLKIEYNVLDLPKAISGSKSITYTYDASGKMWNMQSADQGITQYIYGIQYSGSNAASVIDFIKTEEGRAVRESDGSYLYQYDLTDHLGNVRVTFQKNPTTGVAEIIQADDYYAFGKRKSVGLPGTGAVSQINKYLYNGKDIQDELGQYDYGARFYDPEIARWNVADPLADNFSAHSPYNYVFNSPVNFTDPDGRNPQNWILPYGSNQPKWDPSVHNAAEAAAKYGSGSEFWGLDHTYPSSKGLDVHLFADGGKPMWDYVFPEIERLPYAQTWGAFQDAVRANLPGLQLASAIAETGAMMAIPGGGGAVSGGRGFQALAATRWAGRLEGFASRGSGWLGKIGGQMAAKGGFDAVGAFKNAISPFKFGNLTNAGRAVTKHPSYFGFESTEALMGAYRTPGALNNLGSTTLKDVLRNGVRTTGAGGRYPNGWTTYTLPNGNAASWGLDGTFIGFRGIK